MTKFDPEKYYKEHSKQVEISSDNELGHRAFAVTIPSDYKVDKDIIYLGDRKKADFYFYHDINFLSDMIAGKAKQLDAIKGELEPFGEYERNESTVEGYTHQGFHFFKMGGLDYFFRCSYKMEYKEGKEVCSRIIKSIIPSTITREYYIEKFGDYTKLTPTK